MSSAWRMIGVNRPAFDGHGHADVGILVAQRAGFRPGDVGGRHLRQRQRQRLDDEVVDRELVGARALLGRGRVHALAGAQQLVDAAIDGQIEVRDGLLGQGQALGDDLAHAVVRHDLVGALLVERQDLVVGHGLRAECRRRARRPGARRCRPWAARAAALERRLDVALDDAPVRARAGERRKIDARLLGEPARQRRSEDAAVAVGAGGACRAALAARASASPLRGGDRGGGSRRRQCLRSPPRPPCVARLGARRGSSAWRARGSRCRARRLPLAEPTAPWPRSARRRFSPSASSTAIGVLTFTPSVPSATSSLRRPCPRRPPPPPWWPCRSRSRR